MRFGLDPDLDLELSVKPIIQELVRTQVCFPNLKLLVDRIAIVTVPDVDESSGNQAYKLTLTDGERTIPALLKRRIYKILYNDDVREGSYVILKVYHLAQAERLNGPGMVNYLVIEDFYSIGEDDRDRLEPIEEATSTSTALDREEAEARKSAAEASSRGTSFKDGLASQDLLDGYNSNQDENSINDESQKIPSPTPPSSQQLREAMKRKWDIALDEIDTNDTYRISKYRKLEEARAREAQAAAEASAKAQLVRYQSLPSTPLMALTGENKQRNTRHDVLALIVSLSPDVIRRPGMFPKRDLRIMDTSTVKKVSLSVFVNAETFQPEPGTVALFKHLTTHDFDGGSLNAYSKECHGKAWFIPDPQGFANGEVAQLKDCWTRLQYSEQVAREQDDSLSQIGGHLDIPEEEDIADHLPPVSGKKHLTCFYWAKNGTCRNADDECAYAHYNTGIVAHDPMRNQPYLSDSLSKDDKNTQNSGLPPSRSLTCFFWARNRKCNRSDEECSYAHYDTGTIARAPPGVTVFEPEDKDTTPLTKTLTCYFWNKNGRCSRSDAECAYAHYDTGTVAYPPPNVVASLPTNPTISSTADGTSDNTHPNNKPSTSATGKSLTCFFWARNGRCNRSDSECAYAHYDTGTVAHNPNPAAYPEIINHSTTTPTTTINPAPRSNNLSTPAPPLPSPSILPLPQPSSSSLTPSTEATTTTTTTTTITTPAAISPPPAGAAPPDSKPTPSSSTTTTTFPPVKHLTCYFWANFGRCRRSDEECNYAHFHTGRLAVNPAQLVRKGKG
ncbi:MAG: hypothetical protein Q9219_007119 [cf. Caloplaca sp. 3 TL-2023]